MIYRPPVLILTISFLLLTSCDGSLFDSNSRLGRAIAALSGDAHTENALFFTQNISLLQQLHSTNADMRRQLKNIWTGKKTSSEQLRLTLDTADQTLENLDLATRPCSISANTSSLRESVILLDTAWKQQLINARLSLIASQHLIIVRKQLLTLLNQSNQFTKAIIDHTATLSELRASKESSTMFYLLTYILSKSAELEQRIQHLLTSNIMNEKQLKKIMRSRTNIERILRGMFRGDARANIKIVLNPKRRKIITSLQKQFKQQDYLALATAYEKLLEKQFSESNTSIDFDKSQKLINKTVDIAKSLIENGHQC